MVDTRKEYLNEERERVSFINVLRPVYDAFIKSILSSPDIVNEYNGVIPHLYTENYRYGRKGVEADGKPCLLYTSALIIDDPVKPEDAISDTPREKVNQRFETTIRNRVNSRNTPIIIIMQRLHEHDLCGYLMETEPGEWTVLSLPAIIYENGKEKALWEFKHTIEELHRMQRVNSYVFETQYMQNPTPMEGLMYGKFKTYEAIPITNRAIRKNYTDTADTGSDYLCSIDYIDTEIGNFILDVLFTQKEMEFTEPETCLLYTS